MSDRAREIQREWGELVGGPDFDTWLLERLVALEAKHEHLVAFVDDLMDEAVCEKCGLGLHVGCYGCKLKAVTKERDDLRDEVARQRDYIERLNTMRLGA